MATRTRERLWTPVELAEHLSLDVLTLRNWRSQGRGPEFIHVGRLVRYPESAVDAWLKSQP